MFETPQEKALMLYDNFKKIVGQIEPDDDYCAMIAKECAASLVKEMIRELKTTPEYALIPEYILKHWIDIKYEVSQL